MTNFRLKYVLYRIVCGLYQVADVGRIHPMRERSLRALKRSGRVLPVDYQAERRQLAEARRAAFVVPPSGPNQVWQLDFVRHEAP